MIKKSIFYMLLTYVMLFLNVILNLVFIRSLPVVTLGNLAIAKVWMQAADYTHLGTRFAIDRYVPVEDALTGEHIFLLSIWLSLLISFLLFIFTWFIYGFDCLIFSFIFAGLIIALGNIIKSYARAKGEVDNMLKSVFFIQLLPLAFIVGAFLIFESPLLLFFYGLIHFVFFVFYLYFFEVNYSFFLSVSLVKPILIKTWKASALLFSQAIIGFFIVSVDRFIIDFYLGKEALGHYSVIMFAFAALFVVPSVLAEMIFPKIIRQTVDSGRLFYPKELLFIFFPTLVAVFFANYFRDFFIKNFTLYANLLDLIHLATLGILPYAFTAIFFHVLNAMDFRKYLFFSSFIILILYSSLLGYFVLTDIHSIAYFVYAKISIGYAFLLSYLLFFAFLLFNPRTLYKTKKL